MGKQKIWIWEDDKYPNFNYNKNHVSSLLLNISKQQGLLEGIMRHLSKEAQDTFF